MRIAVNLSSLNFVSPVNPAVSIPSITMRRNDVLPIELLFFKDGFRFELSDSASVEIQVNESGVYGGGGLAGDDSLNKVGSGLESEYNFTLDLTNLDSQFSESPASIAALLSVKISEGEFIQSTEPLPVTMQNSII